MDDNTKMKEIAKIFCELFCESLKRPSDDPQEDIDKFIVKRMSNTLDYMNAEGFIEGFSIDKITE
jgi:hypothetical protein